MGRCPTRFMRMRIAADLDVLGLRAHRGRRSVSIAGSICSGVG